MEILHIHTYIVHMLIPHINYFKTWKWYVIERIYVKYYNIESIRIIVKILHSGH